MKVRGVPVPALAEAVVRLGLSLAASPRRRLRGLIAPVPGRTTLTAEERRLALGADALLRRLGVRCLRRAAVVTGMLRRRGIAARVRLSVAVADPRTAHAEAEVAGLTIRPDAPGMVVLR